MEVTPADTYAEHSLPAACNNSSQNRVSVKGLIFVLSLAKLNHINLSEQVLAKNRFLSAIMQLSEEIIFVRFMSRS